MRRRHNIAVVIERIVDLFKDHPDMITGFNKFLPDDWQLETVKKGDGYDIVVVEGC